MKEIKKRAFQLIFLLGIISLLGDIVYEGARGVSGQYLNILGVKAATVGLIVGIGELLGYVFRLASGFFADKTRSYWLFTSIGYGLLVSIPLISLTGVWQIVALFIILERIGKGIRTPARDTIASHAAKQVGTGFGFGLAELLDQIGAVIGPLIFALVFAGVTSNENLIGAYQRGFSMFWIPFAMLLLVLYIAYTRFKKPEELETPLQDSIVSTNLPKSFWFYVVFVFITTLGFISFALVGFHLKKLGIINDASIALLYAGAMAIDAAFGLVAGRTYDRLKASTKRTNAGFFVLLAIPILAAFMPLFVFSKTLALIIVGIVIFGLVVGVQETILKAAVADMTPIGKRSGAYGIFNVAFGLAFFIGNSLAGLLYDYSISILIVIFAVIELMAIPIIFKIVKAD